MDSKQSSIVALDMTLFIRLLEIAREELKTDEALHLLAERVSEAGAAKGQPLTMDDYHRINGHDKTELSSIATQALARFSSGR